MALDKQGRPIPLFVPEPVAYPDELKVVAMAGKPVPVADVLSELREAVAELKTRLAAAENMLLMSTMALKVTPPPPAPLEPADEAAFMAAADSAASGATDAAPARPPSLEDLFSDLPVPPRWKRLTE